MTSATENESLERRKILRGSIKLLVSIGVLFLLVPFFRSIPWPEAAIPENSTAVPRNTLIAGVPLSVTLQDGSTVFVTRLDDVVRNRLHTTPEERFWYPPAPGLLSREYLAVQAATALDETVSWLPPQGEWSGGFIAPSGAAWDLAGRALKPFPGHPGGHAMKVPNLMPSPWQETDDAILLIPLPTPQPAIKSSE